MQETIQILKQEIKEKRLMRMLNETAGHHRIQTTEGYREAAHACARTLSSHGIDARVLSYPMKEHAYAGTYRLFPQWDCHGGACRLIEPFALDLADYDDDPIQIITQSIACDYRGHPLEIVEMTRGSSEQEYAQWDLEGKILFTHEQVKKYRWATERRGALGIISDYLNETDFYRSPQDLPDTVNYTGFWWDYHEQHKAFGFVISPRLSARLHAACELQRERYARKECDSPYPKAEAWIDAEIHEGSIEVVEAHLPGQSEENVLICAHLCHPYASANDNASGVSGAMETMIALHDAVQKGKLPPLDKGVKMILVPEFTGTFHYLYDGRKWTDDIAAINLDMIGARQDDINGPITLTHLPYACTSICGELGSLLLEEVKAQAACREDVLIQNVMTKEEEFVLGSDHYILSDPSVRIPCVMLGQMPDLYYHTSSDTVSRIDPDVLKFSTVFAASYVYTLCNMKKEDVRLIFLHQRTHLMKQIEQKVRHAMREEMTEEQLNDMLAVLKDHHCRSARSITQFCPDAQGIQEQIDWICRLCPAELPQDDGSSSVYVRTFRTPLHDLRELFLEEPDALEKVMAYEKRHAGALQKELCEVLCVYWIDGRMSREGVIARTEAESGVPCRHLLEAYLDLLEELKLIEISA